MTDITQFPTQPLEGESNESFAERKRQWARDNSERIMNDPSYQGCDCACHHGWPTYHVVPCHPDGYEAPVEKY